MSATQQQTSPKSLMFADIVGSSKLYKDLGNSHAQTFIDKIIADLNQIIIDNLGFTVKTIGDEIMCCFNHAENAANAANEMHFHADRLKIKLKIGISTGETIQRNGDMFGDTVNNAAFLANTASASQTLIDVSTFNIVSKLFAGCCESFDSLKFKGHKQYSNIYRLNWEQSCEAQLGATIISSPITRTFQTIENFIVFKYKEKTLQFKREQLPIIFGRDANSVNVHINCPKSSRKHCTVDYEKNSFILTDHSTNGTYIYQNQKKEVLIKRKSYHLQAQGHFSIGLPIANKQSSNTIYFSIT